MAKNKKSLCKEFFDLLPRITDSGNNGFIRIIRKITYNNEASSNTLERRLVSKNESKLLVFDKEIHIDEYSKHIELCDFLYLQGCKNGECKIYEYPFLKDYKKNEEFKNNISDRNNYENNSKIAPALAVWRYYIDLLSGINSKIDFLIIENIIQKIKEYKDFDLCSYALTSTNNSYVFKIDKEANDDIAYNKTFDFVKKIKNMHANNISIKDASLVFSKEKEQVDYTYNKKISCFSYKDDSKECRGIEQVCSLISIKLGNLYKKYLDNKKIKDAASKEFQVVKNEQNFMSMSPHEVIFSLIPKKEVFESYYQSRFSFEKDVEYNVINLSSILSYFENPKKCGKIKFDMKLGYYLGCFCDLSKLIYDANIFINVDSSGIDIINKSINFNDIINHINSLDNYSIIKAYAIYGKRYIYNADISFKNIKVNHLFLYKLIYRNCLLESSNKSKFKVSNSKIFDKVVNDINYFLSQKDNNLSRKQDIFIDFINHKKISKLIEYRNRIKSPAICYDLIDENDLPNINDAVLALFNKLFIKEKDDE